MGGTDIADAFSARRPVLDVLEGATAIAPPADDAEAFRARWIAAAVHHLTDASNGARFAKLHRDGFSYLVDRRAWLAWDGRRWHEAHEGELLRAAKEVAQGMLVDAAEVMDLEMRKKVVAFALQSANEGRLKAMIKLAASEQIFEARVSDFDLHHHLLNVVNGTLDLRTGMLRPHSRADRLTKLTPIAYDRTAKAPRWMRFLDEVFAGDHELIAFVKRAVGSTLTGYTREHAFFLLYGAGRNGKGRFINQLTGLLGNAACTTAFTTFTADRAKQMGNTPELAELAGARLVSAGEPDQGVRLSESTIKSLTGEDEIMACKKYEHPFTFIPRFKLWLHTNHKPEIRGTDDGIWRRPRLIPFTVSFEGRADLQLDEKLSAERGGILAWAVEGAVEWFTHGLGTATAVTAATATYREESDPLTAFLEECVRSSAGAFVRSVDVYAAYVAWCGRNGSEPWKAQTLSKALTTRGHQQRRGALVRGFVDVELIEDLS